VPLCRHHTYRHATQLLSAQRPRLCARPQYDLGVPGSCGGCFPSPTPLSSPLRSPRQFAASPPSSAPSLRPSPTKDATRSPSGICSPSRRGAPAAFVASLRTMALLDAASPPRSTSRRARTIHTLLRHLTAPDRCVAPRLHPGTCDTTTFPGTIRMRNTHSGRSYSLRCAWLTLPFASTIITALDPPRLSRTGVPMSNSTCVSLASPTLCDLLPPFLTRRSSCRRATRDDVQSACALGVSRSGVRRASPRFCSAAHHVLHRDIPCTGGFQARITCTTTPHPYPDRHRLLSHPFVVCA
jgi:hypothetical protein